MATFSPSRYFVYPIFFLLCVRVLAAEPILSFSFSGFQKQDPNFHSQIALMGDADIVDPDSSSVRVTRPFVPSSGRVMLRKPIRISRRNPAKVVSFSTYLCFSISPGDADGLAFLVVPKPILAKSLNASSFGVLPGVVAVEFDTAMDRNSSDPNANHVGVDIGGLASAKVRDVSEVNLVLNSGQRLHCWIDYDLNSRQLQARLNSSGIFKPIDALISYRIDLSEMLNEGVFLGISSSSRNSTQATRVYSWSFSFKSISSLIHSEPVNPQDFAPGSKLDVVQPKNDYLLRTLTTMILGAGCGATVAALVLFLWSMYVDKHRLAQPQFPVYPVEVGYEKIVVVNGDKAKVGAKK